MSEPSHHPRSPRCRPTDRASPTPTSRPPTASRALLRLAAASLLGALVALGAGACDRDDGSSAAAAGRLAPAFQLETLEHGRFYLRDQRGKPVVLLFWDTSCEVCKREMVELEQLRRALGPDRVAMASVCNDPENVDVARSMVGSLGLGFPTLLDRGGKVTEQFQVKAFPTTIVLTAAGRIALSREGYTEPLMGQLRTTLERQLDASSHAE